MKKQIFFWLFVMLGSSLPFQDIVAYQREPITYGSIVTLRHALTNRYLTASEDRYFHDGSSGQPAVYAADDGNNKYAQWIVKGLHSGDRWNFTLDYDMRKRSMIGWPVRRDCFLRLENVGTSRNLHAHHARSPLAHQHGQHEVTNLGNNGIADANDNFFVEANDAASGFVYLASGFRIKLRHANTGWALHSHGLWWQSGKQEVTIFGGRDDNDWWRIEIVDQPYKNGRIKPVYDSTRSTKLTYWTPLFWDPESDNCDNNNGEHRVWAHGGSRHDRGNNAAPHDHMELILGPRRDERARRGPSVFVIHNADDKFRTGSIKFGDKVKILAVYGGAGESDKQGLLKPFRYLWELGTSRWGDGHKEIVVSRPEHPSAQGKQAVFIFEPIMAGQEGEISSMDLVRIRTEGSGNYMWTHPGNRHNWIYWEILLDKNEEDSWGKRHHGTPRVWFWEKYRFSLALPQVMSDNDGRNHLATINNEIKEILGAEAVKKKAIDEENLRKKLEQEKAELENKRAAEQAEAERLKQASAKQLEDLKKANEEAMAKAKAEADAVRAKDKEAADAILAAAQKAAAEKQKMLEDVMAKERAEARKMMQDAKDSIDQAKKEAEELAKQKIDEAAAKAKAEAQILESQAEELKRTLNLPIGFVKLPGRVKSVALGLQDKEIEKTVDNKGTKKKELTFDDFGVAVLEDGSLVQYQLNSDPSNPWMRVVLADEKGVSVKVASAAVGLDGTTYVVSQDGKSLYGISWPGDAPAVMPQESKGFAAADGKNNVREKKAKRRGARRKRKGKKKGKHANKGKHAKKGGAKAGKGQPKPGAIRKAKKDRTADSVSSKKTSGEKTKKSQGKHAAKKKGTKKAASDQKGNDVATDAEAKAAAPEQVK